MRRSRPYPRAFTLLELLCVLGVVAALAALAAPRLSASLGAGRLQAQARAAVALARKARALATSEGRAYLVVVDGEGRELRLARQRDPLAAPEGDDPEREALADAFWARPVPFEEGVELLEVQVDDAEEPASSALGGAPPAIAFAPDGSAEAAILSFEGPAAERLEVWVDGPLGLARIVRPEEAP